MNTIGNRSIPSCPLCASQRLNEFPLQYAYRGRQFSGKKCHRCSFVFLSPRPTEEDLRSLYSDEYFLHDGADCGAHSATDYRTAAIRGSVKFPEILGWIKKYKPSGDFFEVGCGMGLFLDFARNNGYTVRGIEFARLGTQICREELDLDVQQGRFEDFPAPENRYDVVFMGDVLEHMVDPLAMTAKARSMLRADGILAVEVPSMFNSIVGRAAAAGLALLKKKKNMSIPPYHINEFTPRTVKAILKAAGFSHSVVIQRIKSPAAITLRGTRFEKNVKKTLQYPNYFITKSIGILGDRLLGIGIK